jgi:hypothetical protein
LACKPLSDLLKLGNELIAHITKSIENGEQLATVRKNPDGTFNIKIYELKSILAGDSTTDAPAPEVKKKKKPKGK